MPGDCMQMDCLARMRTLIQSPIFTSFLPHGGKRSYLRK